MKAIKEIIASAIADMRGFRNGVPKMKNILDFLPDKLKKEVFEDADNIIKELREQGYEILKVNQIKE